MNQKNQTTNLKGNVHLLYMEYDHCVVHRCKTQIQFIANNMNGYLQCSTKSTAKVILLSILKAISLFIYERSVTYSM